MMAAFFSSPFIRFQFSEWADKPAFTVIAHCGDGLHSHHQPKFVVTSVTGATHAQSLRSHTNCLALNNHTGAMCCQHAVSLSASWKTNYQTSVTSYANAAWASQSSGLGYGTLRLHCRCLATCCRDSAACYGTTATHSQSLGTCSQTSATCYGYSATCYGATGFDAIKPALLLTYNTLNPISF